MLEELLHSLEPADHILDLACGNGVIGLAAWHQGLSRRLTFCDESAMAICSARENATHFFKDAADAFGFHHGDGLKGLPEQADLILCNPPFHLGHTVDDLAGRRLLAQCAGALKPEGQLIMVANAHLKYRPILSQGFHEVEQLQRNRKFVLWRARRPKQQ